MQYNKGMLSNARDYKQSQMEQRNPIEHATSLINLYHSCEYRVNLSEAKKNEARTMILEEIGKIKPRLPKHFRDNIQFWLNNRDVWLLR